MMISMQMKVKVIVKIGSKNNTMTNKNKNKNGIIETKNRKIPGRKGGNNSEKK